MALYRTETRLSRNTKEIRTAVFERKILRKRCMGARFDAHTSG